MVVGVAAAFNNWAELSTQMGEPSDDDLEEFDIEPVRPLVLEPLELLLPAGTAPPSPPPSPDDGAASDNTDHRLIVVRGPGADEGMLAHSGGVYVRPAPLLLDIEGLKGRIDALLTREQNQTNEIKSLHKQRTGLKSSIKLLEADYKAAYDFAADETVKVVNADLELNRVNGELVKAIARRREYAAGKLRADVSLEEATGKVDRAISERDEAVTRMNSAEAAAAGRATKLEVQGRKAMVLEQRLTVARDEARAHSMVLKQKLDDTSSWSKSRTAEMKVEIELLSMHVNLLRKEVLNLEREAEGKDERLRDTSASLKSAEEQLDSRRASLAKQQAGSAALLLDLRTAIGLKKFEKLPALKVKVVSSRVVSSK